MTKFLFIFTDVNPDTEPIPSGSGELFDSREDALKAIRKDMQSLIQEYSEHHQDAPEPYIADSGLFLELDADNCVYYNIISVKTK